MSLLTNAMQSVGSTFERIVPAHLQGTLMLRSFGLLKVPMIFYASPVVEELDDHHCVVRIPLTWRTRNHYKSMYFGALAVGADCTAGLLAMYHSRKSDAGIALLFKDFKAEFIKRPSEDVLFHCNDGDAVARMVEQAARTGERVNHEMHLEARGRNSLEVVAKFTLTLSLKRSEKRN